jgi:uncharacterized protein YwgA
MSNINNRKDILLLLLYSPGASERANEPIVGRTRLIKMLFLFKVEAMEFFKKGTEINEANFYDFFAWNFGPFSTEVYDDLEFFELRGFIRRSETQEETIPESAAEWQMWLSAASPDSTLNSLSEYEEEEFQLTEKGSKFSASLYNTLTPSQKKLLKEFRLRTTSVPLRALLRYVYENYPEQTTESEILEKIVG